MKVKLYRFAAVLFIASVLLVGCGGSTASNSDSTNPPSNPPSTPVSYTLSVAVSGPGTVVSTPGGILCGNDCSESLTDGTLVTLTATATTGGTFNGWSGACSGTGNCTVTMSAARTVSATFVRDGVVAGAFEGFGANVTGGAGGSLHTVTNLNNSGAGSLREALSGSNRIIQFGVAGTIALSSDLNISGTNITLDGFSAPAPGITLSGKQLVIRGNTQGPDSTGSNIIVQGLRFRGSDGDAIQIAYNSHDIVVDHNSMSGMVDGGIDITEGAYNVTLSYNILDYANSANGPGASLLNSNASRVSYHHNIFYGARDRNPILTCSYIQNYSTGPPHSGILADVRYNIVWGYGIGTYILSSANCVGEANVVANLYRNNGATNSANVIVRSAYDSATRADAYIAGNVAVHDPSGCAYSYNNAIPCFNFQTTNSQNNHAAYPAPPITGPSVSNQQERLNEWQKVKDVAGVIAKFADDSADSVARTAVSIPNINIFSQPWSD